MEFRYSHSILLRFTVSLFLSNLDEKVTCNEQKVNSNEQQQAKSSSSNIRSYVSFVKGYISLESQKY